MRRTRNLHDAASARGVSHRGRARRAVETQECAAFLTAEERTTDGCGGDACEPDADPWMSYAISEHDAVVLYDVLRGLGEQH